MAAVMAQRSKMLNPGAGGPPPNKQSAAPAPGPAKAAPAPTPAPQQQQRGPPAPSAAMPVKAGTLNQSSAKLPVSASPNSANAGGVGDLQALKEEILAEVRRELNQMKEEILDAIRSGR